MVVLRGFYNGGFFRIILIYNRREWGRGLDKAVLREGGY